MKKLTIDTEFLNGDIVFLRVREERVAGMITCIRVCASGIVYVVTWEDGFDAQHYAVELTTEYVPSFN